MCVGNFPDQLRLYYQVASGNLVVADWLSFTQFDYTCTVASIYHIFELVPYLLLIYWLLDKTNSTQVLGRSSGWNLNEDILLGQFGMEAPITSFANGQVPSDGQLVYGNVTMLPSLIDILMSGTGGVTAVEWFVEANFISQSSC